MCTVWRMCNGKQIHKTTKIRVEIMGPWFQELNCSTYVQEKHKPVYFIQVISNSKTHSKRCQNLHLVQQVNNWFQGQDLILCPQFVQSLKCHCFLILHTKSRIQCRSESSMGCHFKCKTMTCTFCSHDQILCIISLAYHSTGQQHHKDVR